MQRLHSVDSDRAQGRVRELYDAVEKAFGSIPNAVRVMANSPVVLESYLAFGSAMGGVAIGEKLHNQVKLNTSESNSCDYCTSILCAIGPASGLSAEDILAGRSGEARDARTQAALSFAEAVLDERGKVTDEQLAAVREAGFGDGEIVEIVASVVLGCFTNFLNNVADTELDIPQAEPLAATACDSAACAAH